MGDNDDLVYNLQATLEEERYVWVQNDKFYYDIFYIYDGMIHYVNHHPIQQNLYK